MINRLKRIVAAIALAITAFASTAYVAPTVAAEENKDGNKPAVWLQISPVSSRVTLEAGKALEYSFTVSNIGSEGFTFSVYAAPYTIKSESYDVNFSEETNRTQISRWIQFKDADGNWVDTTKFTIPADGNQTVEYRVKVPDDIPEGGQYAAIFAETEPSSEGNSASGLKTVSRAGLIVYGRTNGDTRETAEINDFEFNTFLTTGKVSTGARVTNTGNTDFEAKYSMTIKSLFGKTIYEKDNSYNVLPDTTRKIFMEWDDTPSFGIFRATARVSAAGEVHEESKIVMIVPLFIIIIVLILLTILIVWTIILIKKRNEQKAKLVV
ncbi:hypothetical protein IJI55_02705 [Candidatus Saccharibacteria bacterium]|nr:hypothetical protein [Candidatus Saccharibacteria bacterium]